MKYTTLSEHYKRKYGHLVLDFVEAGDIAVMFITTPANPEDTVN